MGKLMNLLTTGSETFSGKVKSFHAGNGYGFVKCEETYEKYHGDVFLHKNEFVSSGACVGQEVSFQVSLSERGQPRAVNMIPIGEPPDPEQRRAEWKAQRPQVKEPVMYYNQMKRNRNDGSPQGMLASMMMQMGMLKPGDIQQPVNGQQYFGQINSFNQMRGFGFIECPDLGGDIFLHYGDALNFRVGDFVSFTLDMEEHSNKARGVGLELMGEGGIVGMMSQLRAMCGMPPLHKGGGQENMGVGAKGGYLGKGGVISAPGMSGGMPWSPTKEFRVGVKSMNYNKGYAFCGSEEMMILFGRDIYISAEEVQQWQLQETEEILITVDLLWDGRPQAKVTGKPSEMAANNQSKLNECGQGPFSGLVKSYNENKGFGFIECHETEQVFGQDVFLHKKEMDRIVNQAGSVGSMVRFTIQLNLKGKPQAWNCQVLDALGNPVDPDVQMAYGGNLPQQAQKPTIDLTAGILAPSTAALHGQEGEEPADKRVNEGADDGGLSW